MQIPVVQPRAAKASLSGTRPLVWPSTDVMKEHVWGPRMSETEVKGAEKKYLRDKATLQGTYKDFEAHFVGMMLKQMNKTVQKNPMFHGGQVEEMFTERLNDEMAKNMVEGGKGFGIAEMLEQQHLRKTYFKNEKMATLIREDWDAKATAKAKGFIEGSKEALNGLEDDAKGAQDADAKAKEDYETRREALMTEAGIEADAKKRVDEESYGNINTRMMEMKQATAYRHNNAMGFGIR